MEDNEFYYVNYPILTPPMKAILFVNNSFLIIGVGIGLMGKKIERIFWNIILEDNEFYYINYVND